ncbi:hypothetical protein [Cellulomonas fimi]|uniref:hypothetical protein n=1 Tax=Cellulomonas fimi TaxID=1708 RepID=UPI001461708A|nr:hypothetical protein [Cellulomonas fimi]
MLVEDDQAVIQQEGCPPPDDPEVVAIDNGWWQAPVPVAELTDVESHETDLLPQPRS